MGIVMKFALLLCSLYFVDICTADSLQIGSNINGQLAYVENVKLSSVPLTTRTKTVFYNGDKIIKSISAIDMTTSKAQVRVTAGGVGSTFANIKMKSERGEPLNFQVQIFV